MIPFLGAVIISGACRPRENREIPGQIQQAPVSKAMYVFSKDGLKLRIEPNMTAKVIKIIEFGEKVHLKQTLEPETEIQGVRGKWGKVYYKGVDGYAFTAFLTADDEILCFKIDKDGKMPKFDAACIGYDCQDTEYCLSGSAFFSDGTANLRRNCHGMLKGTWRMVDNSIVAEAIFRSAPDAPMFEMDCRDFCKAQDCYEKCIKVAKTTKTILNYSPNADGTFNMHTKAIPLTPDGAQNGSVIVTEARNEGCLKRYNGRRK